MLGRNYRFTAKNETGQTIAAAATTVNARRYKFASDGSITFETAEANILSNAATLANGAYTAEDAVDNSADKWLGGTFEFVVIAPASSNGNVILYYEESTDGGTDWPDSGLSHVVAVLNFTVAGTKRTTLQL